MKVEITKSDKVVGLKKTDTLYIEIEGDKSLVNKVEKAAKKIIAASIGERNDR